MFGMGLGELIIILVVALLVLGPDKLPEAAKSLSKGIRDFRKQTRELQKTIEDDDEIGGAIRDLKSALRGDELHPPSARAAQRTTTVSAASPAAGAASTTTDGAKSGGAKSGGASTDSATTGGASGSASSDGASTDGASTGSASTDGDTAAAAESGSEDDDMPVIRPSSGAVATSAVIPGLAATSEDRDGGAASEPGSQTGDTAGSAADEPGSAAGAAPRRDEAHG